MNPTNGTEYTKNMNVGLNEMKNWIVSRGILSELAVRIGEWKR